MHSRFTLEINEDNSLSLEVEPSFDSSPVVYLSIRRGEETICQLFLTKEYAEKFLEKFKKTMKACFG